MNLQNHKKNIPACLLLNNGVRPRETFMLLAFRLIFRACDAP